MTYNTAIIPGNLEKQGPAAIAATLRNLVEENMTGEARQVFQSYSRTQTNDLELRIFYVDILIKAGEYGDAERLLETELARQPDNFALLLRLGRIDEIRGRNLSALDLFRRAEMRAKTGGDKKEARAATERVRGNIKSEVTFKPGSFTINLQGNGNPLNLQYSLNQLASRRQLLEALLEEIDPRAKTVLEIECDAGLITRNLAAHGFSMEGAAAEMTDIVLAMGFEYVEMMRKANCAAPDYYQFDYDLPAVKKMGKFDLILVLPCRFQWYRDRGAFTSAELLRELAAKTKRQLFFYIPGNGKECQAEVGAFGKMLLEMLEGGELPSKPELISSEIAGGTLYRINQRQAGPGERGKIVPPGLSAVSSRSAILEVEVDHCRSLNGFNYNGDGWNHFTAVLQELLDDPDLTYDKSILKKFYDSFQPQSRQEQFFGSESKVLPPLDRGWTLLPWVDTKNRRFNPVESPVLNVGGNPHYGPNSDDFGTHVCRRLLATYMLLSQYGYQPEIFPDGYIQGYLLKDGSDYRFYVNEGQHRMAAVGLLGFKTIKARFNPDFLPVVDLKNIKTWPQVRRGLYSEGAAERVFRYYFEEDGRRKAEALGLV